MGWFDKKSWKLRRKIKDLQSELAIAEREGKYVVAQGLFFAELKDMADNTIMVLGTADHLDAEEENIIRNFFDRNGFSVEKLRLDKEQKALADVEIIPPEEFTRRVARELKDNDFRLIDDSDNERSSNLDKKVITLSSIIRSTSALFAEHVHQLIISTPIKMNMEGNRLLHWMPLIKEKLSSKVASPDVINICREPFIQAYNHYYGQLGRIESPELISDFESSDDNQTEGNQAEDSDIKPSRVVGRMTSEIENQKAENNFSDLAQDSPLFAKTLDGSKTDRTIESAFALAQMYKSLIGTSEHRRVRNAELILDQILRFFSAKSASLIIQKSPDSSFNIVATSYASTSSESSIESAIQGESQLLHDALAKHTVSIIPAGDNGTSHPRLTIAPINLDGDAKALVHLNEASSFSVGNDSSDSEHLAMFARIFREFPDLLINDQAVLK